APLRPEARAAVLTALDLVGNPSSPHTEGRRVRAVVEDAREEVAALVGAKPAEVVFTSGATEANNAVVAGGWQTIVLAGIERDSVLAPARNLARGGKTRVINLAVDANGRVDAEDVLNAAREAAAHTPGLLSLQLANNETGVVQPVAAAVEAAR